MLGFGLLLFAYASPADLVIENAVIWSDGLEEPASFAAVKDGKFVYVGDKNVGFIGERTEKLDAEGRLVIPGLIDSHIHMLNGGMNLSQLQLRDAKDKADFIARVKDWAEKLPPDKWVLGGRWSVESWEVPEQPTKEWVDAVTGGRPLFLSRMDGHSALANSAALKLAGITKDGPRDPPGGVIDRDENGEPTGILRETAMGLVSRHIPAPSIEEKYEALKRAIREANRHGITTVCDIPSIADLAVYERLAKDAESTCRFVLYPTASDWSEAVARAKSFQGRDGWIRIGGFKAYFDGSLGSRTAWMFEPYLNNPPDNKEWRGLPMPIVEDGTFERNARAAMDGGFQIIVHCIGDRANRVFLDRMLSLYGGDIARLRSARHRSEHTQHLHPNDIRRFGELGIIASMQPFHKADDGRYAEDYIGADRCRSSYAFRSLLSSGAVVAFGSDWPVVTINPFLGMEGAVVGRTLDGRFWQIQERISVTEALRCYTSLAAFGCFMEGSVGRIAEGFAADFVVLNRSLLEEGVPWGEVRPEAVYVGGRRAAI